MHIGVLCTLQHTCAAVGVPVLMMTVHILQHAHALPILSAQCLSSEEMKIKRSPLHFSMLHLGADLHASCTLIYGIVGMHILGWSVLTSAVACLPSRRQCVCLLGRRRML